MSDWYAGAVKLPFRTRPGTFKTTAEPRGVLHTTESNIYRPSRTDYYGHRNPPHFTITRDGIAYQHYPISGPSRALRHPAGTIETNNLNCWQIEIVGYAKSIDRMAGVQTRKLRDVMRWLETETGIERTSLYPFAGSEAYGANSDTRLTAAEWYDAYGWLGHQHVPNNTHWDPGRVDIHGLLAVTNWAAPGDLVQTRQDAIAAATYQGGPEQADRLGQVVDDSAVIMLGRTLDLLMQHDLRLRKVEP